MKLQEKQKKQAGITLVALVVTIIILIILATISIRMVIGEGGLIWQANNAKVEHRAATVDEEVLSWKAEKQMSKYTDKVQPQARDELIDDQLARGLLTPEEAEDAKDDGQVKIGSRVIDYGEDTQTDQSDEPPTPSEEDKRPLVNTLTELQPDTVEARDLNGNSVVMPGKFKFAGGEKDTVEQGIIIEDGDGNQFVWIPVSNTDGDNSATGEEENLIKKDDGSTVEITLGRYTFSTSNGKETLVQKGSEYADAEENSNNKFTIGGSYLELNESREASGGEFDGVNATAKNLQAFVESVETNHGYYIGRYEASYGSGISYEEGANQYKPLVKKSTQASENSWTPPTTEETVETTKGKLWNHITQGNASMVCRNMYNGNDDESQYVESDLVNSYMWDTAIVYIQAMGNDNYANKDAYNQANLLNTGALGGYRICNIYDLANNLSEWTTENSSYIYSYSNECWPNVYRGAHYWDRTEITAGRHGWVVDCSERYIGFRPGLYIK